ncbi:uncharacterized protein J3D65DRAFT_343440 [Phyllosticta citribraziliensis]|uniref:Uncharacterized protein n=1 Tax=Phyllosticta citribraziliensis TaxID=989973 RepID=A0ABR1LUB6_9PEZI
MVPSIFLVLSLLSFTALAASVEEATCYFPNKGIDTAGYVCNVTAAANGEGSACCLHDDACYENGTCYQDWSGISYRRSCTDKDWRSGNCPDFCLNDGFSGDYARITQCITDTAASCCVGNGSESCCDGNTTNYFTWRPGYIKAVLSGDGTNRLGPYVSVDGTSSGATTTSAAIAASTAAASAASAATATCESSGQNSKGKTAATVASGFFGVAFAMSFGAMMAFWMKYSRERALRMQGQQMLDQVPVPQNRMEPCPLLELSGPERSELDARELPKHNGQSGYP